MTRALIYILVGLNCTPSFALKCADAFDFLIGEGETRGELAAHHPADSGFFRSPFRRTETFKATDPSSGNIEKPTASPRPTRISNIEARRAEYPRQRQENAIRLHIPNTTVIREKVDLIKKDVRFKYLSERVVRRFREFPPSLVDDVRAEVDRLERFYGKQPDEKARQKLAQLEEQMTRDVHKATNRDLLMELAAYQAFVPPRTASELLTRDPEFEGLSPQLSKAVSQMDLEGVEEVKYQLEELKKGTEPRVDLRLELEVGKDKIARNQRLDEEELVRLAAVEMYLGPERPSDVQLRRVTIDKATKLLNSRKLSDKRKALGLVRGIKTPHLEVISLLHDVSRDRHQPESIRNMAYADLKARNVHQEPTDYAAGKIASEASPHDRVWLDKMWDLPDDQLAHALKQLPEDVRTSFLSPEIFRNRDMKFIERFINSRSVPLRLMAIGGLVDRFESSAYLHLERALESQDIRIQKRAAEVLWQRPDPRSRYILQQFNTFHRGVVKAAKKSVEKNVEGGIPKPCKWIDHLKLAAMYDADGPQHPELQRKLAPYLPYAPVRTIRAAILSDNPETRAAALLNLGPRQEPEILQLVTDRFYNEEIDLVKNAAFEAAVHMKGRQADKIILDAMNHADDNVAQYARQRLMQDPALQERMQLLSNVDAIIAAEKQRMDRLAQLSLDQKMDHMAPTLFRMADNVYLLPEAGKPQNMVDRLAEFYNRTPLGWKVVDHFADPDTGLKIAKYERTAPTETDKKEIVYAVAGTQSVSDIFDDINGGKAQLGSAAFKELVRRAEADTRSGHQVWYTGHSLGAKITQKLAHDVGEKIMKDGKSYPDNMLYQTWNGLGAGDIKDLNADVVEKMRRRGRNFVVEGDAITRISPQLGKTYVLPRNSWVPLGNHRMGAIENSISRIHGVANARPRPLKPLPLGPVVDVVGPVGRTMLALRKWWRKDKDLHQHLEAQALWAAQHGYKEMYEEFPWAKEIDIMLARAAERSEKEADRLQELRERVRRRIGDILQRLRRPVEPEYAYSSTPSSRVQSPLR